MRRLVAIFSLAVVCLAGGTSAATVKSGLYGKVTRGPIAPVCVAEQPCSEPARGAVVVFSKRGRVTRTTVRGDGLYRVLLPPGVYAVRATGRSIEPATARVVPGRMRHLDFSIDTGIR